MGGDNVVALRDEPIQTDAKTEFLRYAAETFDEYASLYDEEPEALVLVWCGVKQFARVGWLVTGESEGGVNSCKAMAQVALVKSILSEDDE